MTSGDTGHLRTQAAPASGRTVTSLRLPLSVAALFVCVAFVGLTVLLDHVINRAADLPGVQCANSADFYSPPCPQQFAWTWVTSAYVALALVLVVPAWRQRQSLLAEFRASPAGCGRWLAHAKHPANALVPAAIGAAAIARYYSYGPSFDFTTLEQAVVRLPVAAGMIPAWLAIVSIFDIYSIASGPEALFVPADEDHTRRLQTLRTTLDAFLLILGIQLGAWVVTHAANAEFAVAVRQLQMGGAGPDLEAGNIVVVVGTVATGLLALLYVPTAITIDRVATRMVEHRSRQLDWVNEPDAAGQAVEQLRDELVVKQSVEARLRAGLSIAAPLTGAIFTAFVL